MTTVPAFRILLYNNKPLIFSQKEKYISISPFFPSRTKREVNDDSCVYKNQVGDCTIEKRAKVTLSLSRIYFFPLSK